MLMTKIRQQLRLFARQTEIPSIDGVLSVSEMSSIVELERARANRKDHCFTLLKFKVDGKRKRPAFLRQFARVLHKRIRVVDRVGWLPDHGIGVVLPHTGTVEARSLLRDLSACRTRGFRLPKCTILEYSPEKVENKNGSLRRTKGRKPAPIQHQGILFGMAKQSQGRGWTAGRL